MIWNMESASSKSRTLTPIWKGPIRTFSPLWFSASTRTSGWKAILKLTVSVTRSFLLHFNRTIGPSCIPWVKVTPIHPSLQSVSCKDAVKRNLSNTVTYRILFIKNIQYTSIQIQYKLHTWWRTQGRHDTVYSIVPSLFEDLDSFVQRLWCSRGSTSEYPGDAVDRSCLTLVALVARVQAASRASWMSKFTGEDDSTHRPRLKSQDLWM